MTAINSDNDGIIDRQLGGAAAVPAVAAADDPASLPTKGFPLAQGGCVSLHYSRSADESHVTSDLHSRAQPLPPLASQDRWTIRGSSGEAPQPPPLFLSKA